MKITKKKFLVLIGVLVVLSPFLGLPGFVKSIVIIILGLSVVIATAVNGDKKLCECDNCIPKTKPGSYVENTNPLTVTEAPKEEKEKLRI